MQIKCEDFPVFAHALQSKRASRAESLRAEFIAAGYDATRRFNFVMHMQYLAQGLLPRHYQVALDTETRDTTLKSCFAFYSAFVKTDPAPADRFMAHVLLATMYRKGEGCARDLQKAAEHRQKAYGV